MSALVNPVFELFAQTESKKVLKNEMMETEQATTDVLTDKLTTVLTFFTNFTIKDTLEHKVFRN